MPKVPYLYEVNWQIGQRKWFLNTILFLITKFDCVLRILVIQSNSVIRNGVREPFPQTNLSAFGIKEQF